jgi:hypothetical protein
VGFFRELVGMIGEFQRALRMPARRLFIAFFVMLGCRPMGVGRKFVLLGGQPVFLVHDISSCGSVVAFSPVQ